MLSFVEEPPGGSLPSALSFSRCAANVSAAAGRSGAGTSGHAASEQLVLGAEACVQRLEQPALAVEAMGDVLVELRRRVPDHGAVARDRASRSSERRRRSESRYADSEPSPGAMKTLPSPSTVSPVKQTRPNRRHTLSAECPGVPTATKGPTDCTIHRHDTGTPNSPAASA